MPEREPTVVEQIVDVYADRILLGWKPTEAMIAALRKLQKNLAEFDGQEEPNDAIGILLARHQTERES